MGGGLDPRSNLSLNGNRTIRINSRAEERESGLSFGTAAKR